MKIDDHQVSMMFAVGGLGAQGRQAGRASADGVSFSIQNNEGGARADSPSATIGARLLLETDGFLELHESANADRSATSPHDSASRLPEAVRNGLNDIARDPELASKRAQELGTLPELLYVGETIPALNTGFTMTEINEFHAWVDAKMSAMNKVHQDRSAYYATLKQQALPEAEIYARLLEFNANLPVDYDKTLGWSESRNLNGLSYSEFHKAGADYLRQQMATS